jgi:hypothetical protein
LAKELHKLNALPAMAEIAENPINYFAPRLVAVGAQSFILELRINRSIRRHTRVWLHKTSVWIQLLGAFFF